MARLGERAFLLYAIAVSVALLLLTALYPPSGGFELLRYALVVVLAVVAIARFAGRVAGVLAAAVSSAVLVLLPVAGVSATDIGIDGALDLLAIAAVSGGLALYVGELRNREIEAATHEREAAVLAQLSLDLLPPVLTSEHGSRLAENVRSVLAARDVGFLVPGEGGELVSWLACDTPEACVPGSVRRVAQLVYESAVVRSRAAFDDSAGGNTQGIEEGASWTGLIASRGAYVPLRSGSGIEGVLYALRGDTGRARFDSKEQAFLEFVATLVGTLIERDTLQGQASSAQAIEEADRLKANIISSVSHDLKTPLAAVMATVTSLTQSPEPGIMLADVSEELDSVVDNLHALNRRIGELIDVSRLETSSWKPHLEWNDVEDLCRLARTQFGSEQTRITCRLPEDPLVGRFDLAQMARALYHLIENALVYSAADTPVLVGASADEQTMRIWVEDQGPGIPEAEREAIFEKFRRGTAASALPGGTGLGLSVVTGIVAAHGGAVELTDAADGGSRFTMVVPMEGEEA
ncbi:MAG: ATP-binding protein [Coriobacteriia bacterium]|nr:ATP-binding protein [Coriobacteriia bacterium]